MNKSLSETTGQSVRDTAVGILIRPYNYLRARINQKEEHFGKMPSLGWDIEPEKIMGSRP
jgi:hypothetical protein